MPLSRLIELMEIERECVILSDDCDRQCAGCKLVQNTPELISAYTRVLDILDTMKGKCTV